MTMTTVHRADLPVSARRAAEPYEALVARLSRLSVTKHSDAYADIDWDAAEHRIDPEDARFELGADDPLGATAYYRALPPADRARLGLHVIASHMRVGIDFEAILSRGLLELSSSLRSGAPEIRYAHHEVIEEAQHSLMFHELVRRSGEDVTGLSGIEAWAARRVPALGRTFPELFFLHVLGGEAPIDHLQRNELRKGKALHPLVRRVMQIHVTEEARHVCFARRFLEDRVPRLGPSRLWQLRLHAPFVLRETARLMLAPPASLDRVHGVPRRVLREASRGPAFRTLVADGLRPLRDLAVELGIVTAATVPLWKALGIWERPDAPRLLAGD
jgi:hypothetical protein